MEIDSRPLKSIYKTVLTDISLSSLMYVLVDNAAQTILRMGRLAKVDTEHAYRNVPVHPDDRPLLCMKWQGESLMDTVLPFGLQSAPKIFSTEEGKRVAGHHIEKIEGPSMVIGHPNRRAKDGTETPRSEAT